MEVAQPSPGPATIVPPCPSQRLPSPWLHGMEGVTKDPCGYVFWRGQMIEHYSFGPMRHRDEAMATKRLKRTCEALEEAGRRVTPASYLDWICVLATVHVVNAALFTDLLGCARFYRRAGGRYDSMVQVKRAAMALDVIESTTGLVARLDNESNVDPTAVVLIKISEVASRESTEVALDNLRRRFLQAFTSDGPRVVAALVQESRYEDSHYAGYVGVRLYTGFFEDHCPSITPSMRVLREFAQSYILRA